MKLQVLTALALTGALATGLASADTINGLANTGNGLAAGATDANYTYTVTTGAYTGLTGTGVVSDGNQDPFPYWIANTADSSWLILGSDQQTNYSATSASTVAWTLDFDLTGYDYLTAAFSGRWASDNSGVLLLNGQTLSTISGNGNGYGGWTDFTSVSSYLQAGKNTLTFLVTDDANTTYNYTGLRVEFSSSTAQALAVGQNAGVVPEPETYALMLAGIAALGFMGRRRRS